MKFFTSRNDFTHKGSFYFIPVYLNLDEDEPVISGTNIFYDKLLMFMTGFHNTVIERVVQLWAYITDTEYEAGFPFWISGELQENSRP